MKLITEVDEDERRWLTRRGFLVGGLAAIGLAAATEYHRRIFPVPGNFGFGGWCVNCDELNGIFKELYSKHLEDLRADAWLAAEIPFEQSALVGKELHHPIVVTYDWRVKHD